MDTIRELGWTHVLTFGLSCVCDQHTYEECEMCVCNLAAVLRLHNEDSFREIASTVHSDLCDFYCVQFRFWIVEIEFFAENYMRRWVVLLWGEELVQTIVVFSAWWSRWFKNWTEFLLLHFLWIELIFSLCLQDRSRYNCTSIFIRVLNWSNWSCAILNARWLKSISVRSLRVTKFSSYHLNDKFSLATAV